MWTTITGIFIAALSALFGIWTQKERDNRIALIASVLTLAGLLVGVNGAYYANVAVNDAIEVSKNQSNKLDIVNSQLAIVRKESSENRATLQHKLDKTAENLTQARKQLVIVRKESSENRAALDKATKRLIRAHEKLKLPMSNDIELRYLIIPPIQLFRNSKIAYLNKHSEKSNTLFSSDPERPEASKLGPDQWVASFSFEFYFDRNTSNVADLTFFVTFDSKLSKDGNPIHTTSIPPGETRNTLIDVFGVKTHGLLVWGNNPNIRYNTPLKISLIDFENARVEVKFRSSLPTDHFKFVGLELINGPGQRQVLRFSNTNIVRKSKEGAIFEGRFNEELGWKSSEIENIVSACPPPAPKNSVQANVYGSTLCVEKRNSEADSQ